MNFLDTDSPRRKQPAFGVGDGLESDAKPRREGDLFAFKGERAEVFCGGGVFFAERGLFALDKVVQAAPIAEVIGVLAVLEQETTRDAKWQDLDALEGSDLNFALEDKVAHLFFALFEKIAVVQGASGVCEDSERRFV